MAPRGTPWRRAVGNGFRGGWGFSAEDCAGPRRRLDSTKPLLAPWANRVEFDDPLPTWLYLAPSHGQILKLESVERANRWGYYGLHGPDFAFLFDRRPLCGTW